MTAAARTTLLKVDPQLPEKIRHSIARAAAGLLPTSPALAGYTVVGDEKTEFAACRELWIGSHSSIKDGTAPAGVARQWVNRRSLHLVFRLTPNGIEAQNRGNIAVTCGDVLLEPGATAAVRPELLVHVNGHAPIQVWMRVEPGPTDPAQDVRVREVQDGSPQHNAIDLQIAGHVATVGVPAGVAVEEFIRRAALVWHEIATALQISPVPQPAAGPHDPNGREPVDRFVIGIRFGSGRTEHFDVFVPRPLYELLWTQMPETVRSPHSAALQQAVVNRCVVVGAQQELSLAELRTLAPGKVVILRPDSASLLDPHSKRAWRLVATAGLLDKDCGFKVAGSARPEIRNGGTLGERDRGPDFNKVPVAIQIVWEREFPAQQLEQFAPGSEIPMRAEPGADVKLAINGTILGAGRLVPLSGDKLGVQVLRWDV